MILKALQRIRNSIQPSTMEDPYVVVRGSRWTGYESRGPFYDLSEAQQAQKSFRGGMVIPMPPLDSPRPSSGFQGYGRRPLPGGSGFHNYARED